jgi:hypothetical protein
MHVLAGVLYPLEMLLCISWVEIVENRVLLRHKLLTNSQELLQSIRNEVYIR